MTTVRGRLAEAVTAARDRAIAVGDLPSTDGQTLPPVLVEHPARPEHGDYATNAAMQLAPYARANPMQIADTPQRHLAPPAGVAEVRVERPGFINFRLDPTWVA